jgi:hypothetical protein
MGLLTFNTLPMALQQAVFTRELEPGQRLFRQGVQPLLYLLSRLED